jgi:multicomponent Na+:H+ antiporter subunit D
MSPVLAVIALPAAGAALCAVVPTRWRPVTALGATATTLALALVLARTVLHSGELSVTLGSARVAAVLVADGLGAGLVLASATVALLATAFAAAQSRGTGTAGPAYWPLSLALLTGLHGVVLAGDLVTAYLMLELVAVTGAALVTLGGGRARLAAGTRYFYAEMVASLTLLAGVALVWLGTGTVVIREIAGSLTDTTEGRLGLALITAGLLLKIPVFPVHFWLPAAHAIAAGTVSPWLSALVVKSAFVVLVRVWLAGPVAVPPAAASQVLGALGAAAVLWGGVAALRATEVKRLVAYSTVAQLGLLLLVVPLVGAGSAHGWVGGVVHAIAHALPKAALLMAVSLLAVTMGGTTVSRLAGAAARRPVAVLTVGISAVSLVGLPPTAGFVAKWYLLVASLETRQWWWGVTVVVGGLLTAAYLGRLLQQCLRAPTSTGQAAPAVRHPADVVALCLALLGLALGLFPETLVTLVEVGSGGVGRG